MRFKKNSIIKKIDDQFFIIPLSEHQVDMNVVLKTNKVGAFIYEQLEKDADEETILAAILAKYQVSEEVARRDLAAFLKKLAEKGFLII